MMAWRRENGHLAKEDNPNWDGGQYVTVECTVCGDECDRRRDEVAENTTGCHFCSHECQGEWQSESWVGESHPSWEGGKLNRNEYGPGWTREKREAVRERDGYCCRGCGMRQQEHQDVFGAKLDVHHISPARRFDDPQKRNAMGNLVTFCRFCHMKWEGIPLRPQ
jgi:5-methylcytosine-specific restriction endonuclease McrA